MCHNVKHLHGLNVKYYNLFLVDDFGLKHEDEISLPSEFLDMHEMGERQMILSTAQTLILSACLPSHTHTHTHTLMCTHSMHPSFCLSVCLHLSLSFSQHHVTGCLLSCLILFIFHVSWMFCFSAPLPHLTSDDVDKALQNSPRLMHARNTGKQPCGPRPDSALAPPTHRLHTHTHTHTPSEVHAALRFLSSSACAADAEWV